MSTSARPSKPIIDRQRIRSARSARLLLVRYLTAALFFFDMYWSLMLLMEGRPTALFPLAAMVAGILAATEQVHALDLDRETFPRTASGVKGSLVGELAVMLVTVAFGTSPFFPILSSPALACTILTVTMAARLLVLWRLERIRDHSDKAFDYYRSVRDSIDC